MIIDNTMYTNPYLFIVIAKFTLPDNIKIRDTNKYRVEPIKANKPKHLFVHIFVGV